MNIKSAATSKVGIGVIAGVAGLIIGAASAGSSSTTTQAASDSTPAPTVTVTAPGEAGATVTATATETTTETATETVTAKPAGPKAAFSGDGTFIVGTDIKPGTYRATGAESGNCYWARLKNLSGDFDAILANNNTSGQATVTIKPTDKAFESTGCSDWTKVG